MADGRGWIFDRRPGGWELVAELVEVVEPGRPLKPCDAVAIDVGMVSFVHTWSQVFL